MKHFILLTLLLTFTLTHALPRKQHAGPPSTFHPLPTPHLTSHHSLLPIHLTPSATSDDIIAQVSIPVDTLSGFELMIGSPHIHLLDYVMVAPSGKVVALKEKGKVVKFPVGDYGNDVDVLVFSLELEETGFYSLEFLGKDLGEVREVLLGNDVPDLVVLYLTADRVEIEAVLLSQVVSADREVGLKTRLVVDGLSASEHEARIFVTDAHIEVRTPSGDDLDIRMNDDGFGADEFADDDFFSGHMMLSEHGTYQFEAFLTGWMESDDGYVPFTKTVELLIPAGQPLEFSGSAHLSVKDSERSLIHIDLKMPEGLLEETLGKYRAYSEVYGVDENGASVPVAWVGSIVDVIESTVTLELNVKWITLANAQGPLTLKNTYLVDQVNQMVIAKYDEDIPVSKSNTALIPEFYRTLKSTVTEITDEMRLGVNPLKMIKSNGTSDPGPSLILVHGYCSSNNPWELAQNQGIFEDAAYFLNANANIPTDEFAVMVDDFAKSKGSEHYSCIGHSQGGMVCLHLLNGYWSGADLSTGGPKVQSVGTPWKGCTGAGGIANIGKVFGVTCGQNNDLTPVGAQNWLAGMSQEEQSEVNYYTTTYKLGNLFGDSCSTAVNMILKWPNDGVTEKAYADLPYGNFKGNKEKQCHTTDMNYPAQYLDTDRNREMNANAAR